MMSDEERERIKAELVASRHPNTRLALNIFIALEIWSRREKKDERD